MSIFYELGVIIIVATFFIFLAKIFKQPFLPAYILTGILLGPAFGSWIHSLGFNFVGFITNIEGIREISEIGLAFLLFIVGLELSLKKLKDVGSVTVLGTTIQFVILSVSGFFLSKVFFSTQTSIFIGIMLAFGSTMVVIDILSKKNELDTLHGRIAIGILLVQDIIAILSITLLSGISNASGGLMTFLAILLAFIKAGLLVLITFASAKWIFPKAFKLAAKSQELLLLSSISVAFLFSILADKIGEIVLFFLNLFGFDVSFQVAQLITPGFSLAIGAFLGGVALASSPYALEIIGKISPLKDFFATIFFVSLGVQLTFENFGLIVIPTIVFLIFLLFFKPVVIAFITALFGYEKRTSFMTGISLFQVSEFGLIVIGLGYATNQIQNESIFSMTVLLVAITMVLTSYAVEHKNFLYNKIGKKMYYLNLVTLNNPNLEYLPDSKMKKEVVLVGYNRIGYSVLNTLKRLKKNFLVLDYNPSVIKHLIKQKIHCIYGDAKDPETLSKLHLKKAKFVISTVPEMSVNSLIIKKTRAVNKKAIIFVTAYIPKDALELYDLGADYVVLPHYLGGDHMSMIFEDVSSDVTTLIKHKFNHIQELKESHKNHHSL